MKFIFPIIFTLNDNQLKLFNFIKIFLIWRKLIKFKILTITEKI